MNKINMKIKDNISMTDKVNAINSITSSYFTDGEYTPYYSDMAKTIAIVMYFIEGVEFEYEELESASSLYNTIVSDKELMELVKEFYDKDQRFKTVQVMNFVMNNVKEKVDFEKQRLIHKNESLDRIFDVCDVIINSLKNFSNLNLSQMKKEDFDNALNIMRQLSDKDITLDDITNVIKDAVGFDIDKATAEIIDAKNEEIRELKKYKVLWEGRNVTVSDKVVPIKNN